MCHLLDETDAVRPDLRRDNFDRRLPCGHDPQTPPIVYDPLCDRLGLPCLSPCRVWHAPDPDDGWACQKWPVFVAWVL